MLDELTPEARQVLAQAHRAALERGSDEIALEDLRAAADAGRGDSRPLRDDAGQAWLAFAAEVVAVLRAARGTARDQGRLVTVADLRRHMAASLQPEAPAKATAGVGDAIPVTLGDALVGDLGNARVDARLVLAILNRGGAVGAWLRERAVDEQTVREAFPPQ